MHPLDGRQGQTLAARQVAGASNARTDPLLPGLAGRQAPTAVLLTQLEAALGVVTNRLGRTVAVRFLKIIVH